MNTLTLEQLAFIGGGQSEATEVPVQETAEEVVETAAE